MSTALYQPKSIYKRYLDKYLLTIRCGT